MEMPQESTPDNVPDETKGENKQSQSLSHIARLRLLAGFDAHKHLSSVPLQHFISLAETKSVQQNRLVIANLTGLTQQLQSLAEEVRKILEADCCLIGEREQNLSTNSDGESFHFVEALAPGLQSRLGPFPLKPFRPIFELGYRVEGYHPNGPEVIERLNLLPHNLLITIHNLDILNQYDVAADVVWPWPEKSFAISPIWMDNKVRGAISFSRREPRPWTKADCDTILNFQRLTIASIAKAIVLDITTRRIESFYGNAPPSLPRLTDREKDVFVRLIIGWQDQEIAEELGIVHRTVRKHISSIFEKTGFKDRKALMTWANSLKDL